MMIVCHQKSTDRERQNCGRRYLTASCRLRARALARWLLFDFLAEVFCCSRKESSSRRFYKSDKLILDYTRASVAFFFCLCLATAKFKLSGHTASGRPAAATAVAATIVEVNSRSSVQIERERRSLANFGRRRVYARSRLVACHLPKCSPPC